MKRRIISMVLAGTLAFSSLTAWAYTDVSDNEWYTSAVTNATDNGWFSGYNDGSFRPDGFITRAEMSTVLTRFADSQNSGAADGAATPTMPPKTQGDGNMTERQRLTNEVMNELFAGADIPDTISESELYEITSKVMYGDIYNDGTLSQKEREMISLAVLTTNNTLTILKSHVYAALNAGMTAEEITETVYHCAPYVGASRALEAVGVVNEVFLEKNIKIPESQSTTTDDTRWDAGKEVQTSIFGNSTGSVYEGTRRANNYLPDYCFGDFYTRGTLDVKQREVITFSCLAALGGCDSQLRSHINANNNVGNGRDYLLSVITTCMPYIGFPRSLNAISAINEILPAEAE